MKTLVVNVYLPEEYNA